MQLIVLLSALLASLSGLVAGERPAEPARLEMSAAAAVEQGAAAISATVTTLGQWPAEAALAKVHSPLVRIAHVPAPRTLLSLKQSWLE